MENNTPTTPQPVVYLFHGDDPLALRREVKVLVEQLGDATIAELNITRLDGRQASEDELRSAANAMPFLTARRLVILTNPFAKLNTDATRKRFLALLDGLPESTQLVLVLEDTLDRGKWKSLPPIDSNWMRKWLRAAGERAHYQVCALPSMRDMANWVRQEARRQGGQFSPEAASALASHVGSDTQLASLEVTKLLTYVDWKRPVDASDVEELTAQGGQADVFAMVDALAEGNARQALTMLHRLMETQDLIILFGMITRQFRLLIQAREVIDEGKGSQIAAEIHVHPYVAEKLAQQGRRFTTAKLEGIYHRLLEIDEASKTGQMPLELGLDTFIVSLAR